MINGLKNIKTHKIFDIEYNVPTLGEEADLKAQTFSSAQKPIGSTNVRFSTKPAFLPNVCYKQPLLINNFKTK